MNKRSTKCGCWRMNLWPADKFATFQLSLAAANVGIPCIIRPECDTWARKGSNHVGTSSADVAFFIHQRAVNDD